MVGHGSKGASQPVVEHIQILKLWETQGEGEKQADISTFESSM